MATGLAGTLSALVLATACKYTFTSLVAVTEHGKLGPAVKNKQTYVWEELCDKLTAAKFTVRPERTVMMSKKVKWYAAH